MISPYRHSLLVCLLVLVFFAAPTRAEAGILLASSPSCQQQPSKRPFLPWLDPARYVLAPDGRFSAGAAGWVLAGASVVATNEPYDVHGDDPPAALRLPAGSRATSRPMCVGIQHPTLRLFARNTGSPLGALRIEVLFEDAHGEVHALPIGLVGGLDEWQPTLPLPVLANLLALLPGERTPVAFRFTPMGANSSWLIDGVYVDPYGKG